MEVVGTLQLLWFRAGVVMKMHSKFWTAIDKMPALPMPKKCCSVKGNLHSKHVQWSSGTCIYSYFVVLDIVNHISLDEGSLKAKDLEIKRRSIQTIRKLAKI